MRKIFLLSFAAMLATGATAHAGDYYLVKPQKIRDEKEVAATVENRRDIPARVRTSGTLVALSVREGDMVQKGQVIAVCADRRLMLQAQALDAQVAAMRAKQAQAQAELDRNKPLFTSGALSQSAIDALRTAAAAAAAGLKARQAERAAVEEQIVQGRVLAPASGRVLTVPTALGAVMMTGEVVATIGTDDTIVRVRLPEHDADALNLGEAVRLEGAGLPAQATVSLIYPQVGDGLVQADLHLGTHGGYYVGQRLRAWIPLPARDTLAVPAPYLSLRDGIDFVRLHREGGEDVDVPVLPGEAVRLPDGTSGVEILSGLKAGDQLVRP